MREISTKKIEIGEHVMIDGDEFVAEEHDANCSECAFNNSEVCSSIPCADVILKKVEKQPAEEQDKDIPMTCLQFLEWLSKGNGVWKYNKNSHHMSINMDIVTAYESRAVDDRIRIRPCGIKED